MSTKHVTLSEELRQRIISKKALLFRAKVHGREYVLFAISKPVLRVTSIENKLVYGMKMMLFDKCIALVMRIDDDPSDPLYLDHYINPSKPSNIRMINSLAEKNNFGFAVFDSRGDCIHLSTLPLSAETMSGIQGISKQLPIEVEDQEFETQIRSIKRDFEAKELWDY